mgnify:CR=1 FL=1
MTKVSFSPRIEAVSTVLVLNLAGGFVQLKVGEKVIYPNQGVGIVEGICRKNIAGTDQDFYLLRMVGHNSTVMVPTQNVDHVGLRKLCNKEQLSNLFEILRDDFNEIFVPKKNHK